MKKKSLLILCAALILLFSSLIAVKWDAIFQRGNPIPYLAAVFKLSEDTPFVAVGDTDNIYITKRGEKQALFQMIRDTYAVEYTDQLGSSYLFSDGEKNYTVGSEIYWGRFTVWTLSFDEYKI